MEAVRVDYDPSRISYEELLEVFWESHDPSGRPWRRQYASAIFYRDDAQKRLALEARDREAKKLGREVFTEILPAGRFHPAEDYHQKYYLRAEPELLREIEARYPSAEGLVSSTAAARINGYIGGNGTSGDLAKELPRLGLSPAGERRLSEIVRARDDRRKRRGGPSGGCAVR